MSDSSFLNPVDTGNSSNCESLPRTPDRPIQTRYRSRRSVSSNSSNSSTLSNRESTPASPLTPLTPFESPLPFRNGTKTSPTGQREFIVIDDDLSIEKSISQPRSRRSSSAVQRSPLGLKHRPTRSSDGFPITTVQQANLGNRNLQLPDGEASGKSRPSSSDRLTRPRLLREFHEPDTEGPANRSDEEQTSPTGTERDRNKATQDKVRSTDPASDDSQKSESEPESEEAESDEEERIISAKNGKPRPMKAHRIELMQYGSEKGIQIHNHDICKYILSKRKKNPNPKVVCELGYVYIFESPQHLQEHVKIGYTKEHPRARMETIQRECKIKLGLVKDEHQGAYLHYKYLETIVHLALHSHRKKYVCKSCTEKEVTHDEWFETSNEKALKHVELWRDWIIKRQPFHEDGTLKEYWYWRAEKLRASLGTVCWEDWTQREGDDLLDYLDFWIEKWQKDHWLRLKAHMGRKDVWFWQMGTIMALLVYMRFGSWGMICAVLALCVL